VVGCLSFLCPGLPDNPFTEYQRVMYKDEGLLGHGSEGRDF
jgi:hypothetical protein